MAINNTHPDYDAALPAWSRARDVLAGEDAIKAAGEKYLPRLDSQSDEEYAGYKARASFFGATARTVKEFLDLVFRKAPVVGLGGGQGLKGFVADCDLWGLEFVRYARRVVGEVLSVGRAGSLVMWDSAVGRPWVSLWRAEQILNWEVLRVGQRRVLGCVVLRDGERIRVLRMSGMDGTKARNGTNGTNGANATDGAEGVGECVQEVWGLVDGVWMVQGIGTLRREGVALPFIPFVFHGPRNSRPEPDSLPLADIIAANLDHYRLDADYKHGLHFAALPTAWVSGFDKASPLRIGSSTAWVSEVPGASAGFLEFTGSGLAHLERAIEKVERRMALLGARMTTSVVANGLPGGAVSGSSGGSGDLCGLGSIIASLNESLSEVLRMAQWWVLPDGHQGGDFRAQTATIAMDTDLSARAVTGELISAVVGAWRDGGISRDTMLDWLKRWEVLPEGRSVAEERRLIHGGKLKIEN
jgi:hypothetical protein